MTTAITEGQLTFTFPDGWKTSKFDEWSFYRNQFQRLSGVRLTCSAENCGQDLMCTKCGKVGHTGVKAIDVIAIDDDSCCWCIEIKDYRNHRRTKTVDLADEVSIKVRDSLAAIVAAAINAPDLKEKTTSAAALRCKRFRVVLHLEQPTKHSKLFPKAIKPADVLQKLKQRIKSVDPHPMVLEMDRMNGVAWNVQ